MTQNKANCAQRIVHTLFIPYFSTCSVPVNLQMVVMSYAFPLFFCANFFQIVLPDTYQECLALVARSGDVERVVIARLLHALRLHYA